MFSSVLYFFGAIWAAVTEVGWHCPVTSLLITAIVGCWSRTFLGELDLTKYAYSFKSCPQKGQWWRLLTSPFLHQNPAQMLLNVLILWQCRRVEKYQGSLYFLRYTVVLAFAEGLFSLGLLYLIAMGIRVRLRWQEAAMLTTPEGTHFLDAYRQATRERSLSDIIASQPFGSKAKAGFSGISLAWTSYLLITAPLDLFYVLGLVPIRMAFAPICVILLLLIVEPTHQSPSHTAGFIAGLLLAGRPLQVLPDLFWSLSFALDLALLLGFCQFEAAHLEACRQAAEGRGGDWGGDYERRAMQTSLLSLRAYSDEDIPVRAWPGAAGDPDVDVEAGAGGARGRGGEEDNEDEVEGGGSGLGEARGALAAGDAPDDDDAPDEDEGEFKEWDTLIPGPGRRRGSREL